MNLIYIAICKKDMNGFGRKHLYNCSEIIDGNIYVQDRNGKINKFDQNTNNFDFILNFDESVESILKNHDTFFKYEGSIIEK